MIERLSHFVWFLAANLLAAISFSAFQSITGLSLSKVFSEGGSILLFLLWPFIVWYSFRVVGRIVCMHARRPNTPLRVMLFEAMTQTLFDVDGRRLYPPQQMHDWCKKSGKIEELDYSTTAALMVLIFIFSHFYTNSTIFLDNVFLNVVSYSLLHIGVLTITTIYSLLKDVEPLMSIHYALGYVAFVIFFFFWKHNIGPLRALIIPLGAPDPKPHSKWGPMYAKPIGSQGSITSGLYYLLPAAI